MPSSSLPAPAPGSYVVCVVRGYVCTRSQVPGMYVGTMYGMVISIEELWDYNFFSKILKEDSLEGHHRTSPDITGHHRTSLSIIDHRSFNYRSFNFQLLLIKGTSIIIDHLSFNCELLYYILLKKHLSCLPLSIY
jgi:hypothetical protein